MMKVHKIERSDEEVYTCEKCKEQLWLIHMDKYQCAVCGYEVSKEDFEMERFARMN